MKPVCSCVVGPITCVCFSQDGQCTLSSSLDSAVRLLDKSTGEMLGEWVLFHSQHQQHNCTTRDKAVISVYLKIENNLQNHWHLFRYNWSFAAWCVCFRYTGHKMKGYKLDCCLSSKDTHVLSCSEDGHVYCWDLVEVRSFSWLSWSQNVMCWNQFCSLMSRGRCLWSYQWEKPWSSRCPSTQRRPACSQPWRGVSRCGGQRRRRRTHKEGDDTQNCIWEDSDSVFNQQRHRFTLG